MPLPHSGPMRLLLGYPLQYDTQLISKGGLFIPQGISHASHIQGIKYILVDLG